MDRVCDWLGRITIPKDIRKQLNIADNEVVSLEVNKDSLLIKKKQIDFSSVDTRRITKIYLNKKEIDKRKLDYPVGTKVKLINLSSDKQLVPTNMEGVVTEVDDIGSIHILWENGLNIAVLNIPEDVIERVK